MKRVLAVLAFASALALPTGGIAFAANPHTGGTTGQPNQSCEEQPSGPPGFNTAGFANAQNHYNPGSQYDVACFQVSQK